MADDDTSVRVVLIGASVLSLTLSTAFAAARFAAFGGGGGIAIPGLALWGAVLGVASCLTFVRAIRLGGSLVTSASLALAASLVLGALTTALGLPR